MDYCRNIAVSGGLPSEYQPEQVLSSSCSKLGSLDDLFSGHNPEGDISMEWLSTFVEDCFSNSGNCFPQIPPNEQLQNSPPSTTTTTTTTSIKAPNEQLQKTTSPSTTTSTCIIAAPKPPQQKQGEESSTSPSILVKEFAIPGKSPSTKRKRTPVLTKPKSQITKWSQSHHLCSSDPPLLHQSHWLADSELIVMPKTVPIGGQIEKASGGVDEEDEMDEEEEERGRRNLEEGLMMIMSSSHGQQQQARRCSHCLSQRTPQWRAGPLGPKTLCNACGVRYKSGRLLPEYRPAKSPTFVSFKHSNSHKKVMEMRNTNINMLSSHPSPSPS